MKNVHNYILLVLDSCRFDSVQKVWRQLHNLPKIGRLYEAISFSTWTQPAHMNFMTGRLPWRFSTDKTGLRTGGVELYDDLGLWDRRLGTKVGSILDERLLYRAEIARIRVPTAGHCVCETDWPQ